MAVEIPGFVEAVWGAREQRLDDVTPEQFADVIRSLELTPKAISLGFTYDLPPRPEDVTPKQWYRKQGVMPDIQLHLTWRGEIFRPTRIEGSPVYHISKGGDERFNDELITEVARGGKFSRIRVGVRERDETFGSGLRELKRSILPRLLEEGYVAKSGLLTLSAYRRFGRMRIASYLDYSELRKMLTLGFMPKTNREDSERIVEWWGRLKERIL